MKTAPAERVLALETATSATVVAWLEAGQLVAQREGDRLVQVRNRLVCMIEEVLAEAGRSVGDIQLVAVGDGPGSFTGLRVGLTAAQALALRLGCPVLPVPSALSMCYTNGSAAAGPVVTLLTARAELVVATMFAFHDTSWRCRYGPWVGPVRDMIGWIDQPTWWCGSGLARHGAWLQEVLGADFAGATTPHLPDVTAAGLAQAVLTTMQTTSPQAAVTLAPRYGEAPRARRIEDRSPNRGGKA